MINVVFFGTPEFSKTFLADLLSNEDFFVSAVVTQPDKPVGRLKELLPSPVKILAQEHKKEILQPENWQDAKITSKLASYNADLFVIVAYGAIIPNSILSIPKKGCINVHPSLLPELRGPSPVQSAILQEKTSTGVSIMMIDEKMDHGPILAQAKMNIEPEETSDELLKKAAIIGSPLLIDSMKKYLNGELTPVEQDHKKATFCKLLKKEDGRIDWNATASKIHAQFRALQPWPGIFSELNGKRVKFLSLNISERPSIAPGVIEIAEKSLFVGTATNAIEIKTLQQEGKSPTSATEFLNGHKDLNGTKLA